MRTCFLSQAGLVLLGSSNLPGSAFPVAETGGVHPEPSKTGAKGNNERSDGEEMVKPLTKRKPGGCSTKNLVGEPCPAIMRPWVHPQHGSAYVVVVGEKIKKKLFKEGTASHPTQLLL
jgi:hypothetical protein